MDKVKAAEFTKSRYINVMDCDDLLVVKLTDGRFLNYEGKCGYEFLLTAYGLLIDVTANSSEAIVREAFLGKEATGYIGTVERLWHMKESVVRDSFSNNSKNICILDDDNLSPLHLLDVVEEYRQQAESKTHIFTNEDMHGMCIQSVCRFKGFPILEKREILEGMWCIYEKACANPQNYPVHYLNRLYAAIIAEWAGYESRSDWTDALKGQTDSYYKKRLENGNFYL